MRLLYWTNSSEQRSHYLSKLKSSDLGRLSEQLSGEACWYFIKIILSPFLISYRHPIFLIITDEPQTVHFILLSYSPADSSDADTSDSQWSLHIPAGADVSYSPHSGKPGDNHNSTVYHHR